MAVHHRPAAGGGRGQAPVTATRVASRRGGGRSLACGGGHGRTGTGKPGHPGGDRRGCVASAAAGGSGHVAGGGRAGHRGGSATRGTEPGCGAGGCPPGAAAAGPDNDRGGCNAMSGWDVSDADMANIPGSPRADVPELPDGALDALLTGDLVTDEACAGLQPAAALLAALTAAPQDGELAGHARVLAEFRRRGGMPVHARRSARRRRRSLTSLTAKAAAAAAVAATALGGVAAAAYTGALPAPAQQFAHGMIGAPSPQPSHRPGTPQPSHRPGTPQATPARTDAVGPDATGPAAFGLCTAYAHATAHGTASQKAVAFGNLAAAAGGAAKIAAYCTAVPHPGNSQPGQPTSAPAHPAGHPSSHAAGKPSSHPIPHQGGRPSSAPTRP